MLWDPNRQLQEQKEVLDITSLFWFQKTFKTMPCFYSSSSINSRGTDHYWNYLILFFVLKDFEIS